MELLSRLIDIISPRRETAKLLDEVSRLSSLLSPTSFIDGEVPVMMLLPYKDPLVRSCIVEAKYYGNKKAQEALGNVLADALLEELADLGSFEKRSVYVIPLPLSKRRKKERGYNQVEVVVKVALRTLPARLATDVLSRTRETKPQTDLPREERKQNVRGAFQVTGIIDPLGTYLLIDDVLTTGATMHDALRALKESGARVRAITLAH